MTIAQRYAEERDEVKGNDRRRLWRTYALAVFEEADLRALPGIRDFRSRASDGDLPRRFLPFWKRLPDGDLTAAWTVLEIDRWRYG